MTTIQKAPLRRLSQTRSHNMLDDFPAVAVQPVQWGDQDLFGHVNNAVYLRWFETVPRRVLVPIGTARVTGTTWLRPHSWRR